MVVEKASGAAFAMESIMCSFCCVILAKVLRNGTLSGGPSEKLVRGGSLRSLGCSWGGASPRGPGVEAGGAPSHHKVWAPSLSQPECEVARVSCSRPARVLLASEEGPPLARCCRNRETRERRRSQRSRHWPLYVLARSPRRAPAAASSSSSSRPSTMRCGRPRAA